MIFVYTDQWLKSTVMIDPITRHDNKAHAYDASPMLITYTQKNTHPILQ